MALTISLATTTNNSTANTSHAFNLGVTANAGDVLVVAIAMDNAGASGASSMSAPTMTGETFTQRRAQNYDPGAASAGVTQGIYSCKLTTSKIATDQITLNATANSRMAAVVWKIAPTSSQYQVNYSTSGGTTGAGATSGTTSTASLGSANAVIGVVSLETNVAITGDSDTVNGSWSTQETAVSNSGASLTSVRVASQYKVVTAAGTQTYNTSWTGTMDHIHGFAVFTEGSAVLATLAAPLGGWTSTASGTVAHLATLVAPLGGITAAGSATASAPAVLATLTAPLGGLTGAGYAGFWNTRITEDGHIRITEAGDERIIEPLLASLVAPLGGLSAAATATVSALITATATAPLGGVTAVASATVAHPATATAPLGLPSSSASASVAHPATLAATFGALTGAASATVAHTATATAPLDGLTASATATVTGGVSTSAAAPLGGLTSQADAGLWWTRITEDGHVRSTEAGDERIIEWGYATATAPLGGVTGSATATVTGGGSTSAAAPLGGMAATATARVDHTATATAPLGNLTGSATATGGTGQPSDDGAGSSHSAGGWPRPRLFPKPTRLARVPQRIPARATCHMGGMAATASADIPWSILDDEEELLALL